MVQNKLSPPGIIPSGCRRARKASAPAVRAEVENEYASRMREADPKQKRALQRELEKEIERRLKAQAPHDALY